MVGYARRAFTWREQPHPFVQLRDTSSEGADVFRSRAGGALHAIVADHVVYDRVVFPGAGYLEMARAAASASTRTISGVRGVFFLQPLAIDVSELLVECAVADGSFEVRSLDDEESSATAHCTGEVTSASAWNAVEHALMRGQSAASAAHVGTVYDGFAAIGLAYGPGYRTLSAAWGGMGAAIARLHGRATQEGTEVHPADLDDALCVSGLITSSGGGETRLPFAVDEALLQGSSGELWAVRCMLVCAGVPCLIDACLLFCVCICVRRWYAAARRPYRYGWGLWRGQHRHSWTASSRGHCVQCVWRRRGRSGTCM